MLPTLWNRKKDLDVFSTTFDNLITDFKKDFDRVFCSTPTKWDKENNKATYEFDVPGFNKDNLKVELDKGLLTIEGETKTRRYVQKLTVGNAQDIEADLTDGVLTIVVAYPKKGEDVKKIEVK